MKKCIGYITQRSPDHVRGFAFYADNAEYATVHLEVNGAVIAEQVADAEHKLLSERNVPANHGFNFDLKSLGAFHFRDDINVLVDAKSLPLVPNLSFAYYRNGFYNSGDQNSYFFLHIPKTAGTSFRMMLNRAFNQNEIWPNKSVLALNNKKYPKISALAEMSKEDKKSIGLLMGHYPIYVIRHLVAPPKIITFLRKPFDHMVSLLTHKRTHGPLSKDASNEFVLKNHISDNPQCYYFLPAHILPSEITEDIFQVVIRNLRRCDFVGLQERFEQSVKRIQSRYGWNMGKVIHKNIGKKIELQPEIHNEIVKKTYWDKRLYEEAIRIFDNYQF